MKNILITGASGFIGSHFHNELDESKIINLDLVRPEFAFASTYCKGDIREYESVNKVLSKYACDTIVSIAAEHKDFGISKEDYYKTNEYGTEVLCKAATKHGIQNFIYFSSVAVYGDNAETSTELTALRPTSHYGASKLAGEEVLHKWAAEDSNRKVLIIRPAVVYGERNVANMLRLIQQIDSGMYFHIGKADNVKSIAYVKNLVKATLFLMDRMQPGVEAFNYADEPQMSIREIADNVGLALGRKEPLSLPFFLAYILGLPFDLLSKLTGRDLSISTNRIRKLSKQTSHSATKIFEAGFEPEYGNKEGIEFMVKWFKGDLDMEMKAKPKKFEFFSRMMSE